MTNTEFRELRLQAGLSKMALARLWNVTRQAIQNFERGTTPVPPTRMTQLREMARVHGE